jgi:hypothetical protein
VSPVWYTPLSCREYVRVSRPQTRQSRNVAPHDRRSRSTTRTGRADGSPCTWRPSPRSLEDVDVALEAFNRRSEAQGLRAWSRAEVVPRGDFLLYCATAGEQFSTTTTGGFRFISSSTRVDESPHQIAARMGGTCRSC